MDVKDLPKELLDKLRSMFDADVKVRELRVRQQMLLRSGNYREALEVAQGIDSLFNRVVFEYLEDAKEEVEQVEIAKTDMPLEDKEDLMRHLLVCFMCADIIKSSVMDMDSILHRYDKNMYMEMFNDIRQVMEMSEQKLSYLQKNSGYLKDLVWGEKCDNMYDMMLSKAGSIMRKRKNEEEWGKNAERFNEKK